MHPKRQIVILGKAVFAEGLQVRDDSWTISVWVRDKDQPLGNDEPDLVFPTLMRNFDQAFALVAISVRDHIRSARADGPVVPTGMYDPSSDEPRSPGPLF
jgi:hypothetical protein